MKNFTVVLLTPEYLAEQYGEDSWVGTVTCNTPKQAINTARETAALLYREEKADVSVNPVDFFVIAVFRGHLKDLNPETPRK